MNIRNAFTAFGLMLALSVLLSACSINVFSGHDAGHVVNTDVGADTMFAQMMIPHHEQAIVMADLAATRAEDPAIVDLARQIRDAQAPEIELMATWLEEWGIPRMPGEAAMAAHGGHGMSGMLTQAQLDELASTSGPEFDRLFAIYMIEHHEGAVDMARDVLESGSDPDVAKLAREIIATQEKEILQLQAFLQMNADAASVALSPQLTHVHAAVVSGDTILVATHDGLHGVAANTGISTRIGDSRDDFMALSGKPDQGLVASGHPGPGSAMQNPLGLISSADAGLSWSTLSLAGVVDFHALAVQGDDLVGWDTRGPLQWSRDGGRTWQAGPIVTPTSLAWFRDEVWLADADVGLATWRPGDVDPTPVGIPTVLIAASTAGEALWRLDRDGSVYRTLDGEQWSSVGIVSRVEAFTAERDRAYAVTSQGIQVVTSQ